MKNFFYNGFAIQLNNQNNYFEIQGKILRFQGSKTELQKRIYFMQKLFPIQFIEKTLMQSVILAL